MAALKQAPNIPQVAPDRGRGCVFCACVSDEGDSRLAGSSFGFINFIAASVKEHGVHISVPRSQTKCPLRRR